MNEKRRKRLREAIGYLEKASDIVSIAAMEEQSAHDNLPDELQYNERGEKMEEVASNLESAVELIDEATQLVNESI